MHLNLFVRRAACVGALASSLALTAVGQEKPAVPAGAPPGPGPEHQVLKHDVGVWDATVEMRHAPGGEAAVSQGVETNTLLGGVWLVSDFKSEFAGQPFAGHGVSGWDPAKKKYVGVWVDNMSSSFMLSEYTYDAATKTMSGWGDGPGPEGLTVRVRQSGQLVDADTRVFRMFATGPDGKEFESLKISYKRRK